MWDAAVAAVGWNMLEVGTGGGVVYVEVRAWGKSKWHQAHCIASWTTPQLISSWMNNKDEKGICCLSLYPMLVIDALFTIEQMVHPKSLT